MYYPQALTGLETHLVAKLRAEADADSVTRLLHGMYVYPTILVLLALSSASYSRHPILLWGVTILTTVGLLARITLIAAKKNIYQQSPELWRKLTRATVLIIAVAVGWLYSGLTYLDGFQQWSFELVMVWVTGVAAGSIITFTPDLASAHLHLLPIYLPVLMVCLWLRSAKSMVFFMAVLLFLLFLLSHAKRLNEMYWKQLVMHAAEIERTKVLERAIHAAEAASRAKGEFIAHVSHEIRTPIHGILGTAELALDAREVDEQRQYVQLLHHSGENLLGILNELLDLSKIEAGKLELEQAPFELATLINDVVSTIKPTADRKGLRVMHEFDPRLPQAIVGDRLRIQQVLVNLAGNAVKFTETGFVSIGVSLMDEKNGICTLRFHVRDTGIGIPPEKHAVIFEAFSQADGSIARKFGGTGLGLSISVQLVQLMKGQMHLESNPGHGSTFSFSAAFPVAILNQAEPTPAADAAMAQLQGLRVLIAEDNAVSQMLCEKLLTQRGCHVVIAATGLEVLAAMKAEAFDIILMDDRMPEMNGPEAAQALRGLGHTLPIIALSANASASDTERFLAAGMNAHLAKPFRAQELYQVLAQFAAVSRPA